MTTGPAHANTASRGLAGRVVPPPARPPLRRPREAVLSGVSAGLGAHLGWSVTTVRVIFVALAVFSGAGILLYLWLWVTVPMADVPAGIRANEGRPTHHTPVAWVLTVVAGIGLVLLMTGTVVGGNGLRDAVGGTWFVWDFAIVAAATGAGVWGTVVDRTDPARGPRHALAVRTAVTAVLGILWVWLLATLAQDGAAASLGTLLPLLGIAAVWASTAVHRWRELSNERVRRIREEQRSEMAAHLHDSVLQTLALIQNRAGASSEIARLARAQERELRGWLFDGDTPADSDLVTDLRDYAAALELDFAVQIDVVAAGAPAERASGDVAAAAREAMLNAARHAGGAVSVYIEGTARAVDVFVRDRGPGFVPENVPGDRLGVRESIIGRMRRAGGTAKVKSGAGGTEVHLHGGGE